MAWWVGIRPKALEEPVRVGKNLLESMVLEVEHGTSWGRGQPWEMRAGGPVPVLGLQRPPAPRKHSTFHLQFIGESRDRGFIMFHLMTATSHEHKGQA